tara:strand:- start:43 stop:831 length:789 start_codon:yes stop_codon:yes gene_type:complete
MQRNIYIEGEMGRIFGERMTINAPTIGDVFRLIDANTSGLKKYLLDCHEKGIGFAIDVAGNEIEYNEEMLLLLNEGDITITPIAEGAGGGFKKILLAVAIIAFAFYMPNLLVNYAVGGGGLGAAGTLTATGAFGINAAVFASGGLLQLTLYGIGVSLALSGLQEVMAQDPSVDADQEESYLFNGQEQNIIEGDPVPVLYGKLEVPGQPINFELSNFAPDSNSSGPFQEGAEGDTEMENITSSGDNIYAYQYVMGGGNTGGHI